jgi:hypothetical protein
MNTKTKSTMPLKSEPIKSYFFNERVIIATKEPRIGFFCLKTCMFCERPMVKFYDSKEFQVLNMIPESFFHNGKPIEHWEVVDEKFIVTCGRNELQIFDFENDSDRHSKRKAKEENVVNKVTDDESADCADEELHFFGPLCDFKGLLAV